MCKVKIIKKQENDLQKISKMNEELIAKRIKEGKLSSDMFELYKHYGDV